MTSALIQTKFSIPLTGPSRLPRPQLVAQLAGGVRQGHKISVVVAPTGSGKTTLLGEWARTTDSDMARFCWLSLDEQDNDPARFWNYLVAALETHHPGLGEPAKALLQGETFRPLSIEYLLTLLINSLAQASFPTVLVLDDYHVISEERIHAGLNSLLDRLPPQLHLAIASRSEPPIHLAVPRARGQLTELHLGALSFTEEEAALFLNSAMQLDLSPDEITTLEQRTEGWIAGLQLAALALQSIRNGMPHLGFDRRKLADFIQAFRGSHRHVTDYLTGEVLRRQPADVQSFLLKTSHLEKLSAALCDEVLQINTSQNMLASLELANLFLVPLDTERNWYRYHSLWADVLRDHAQRDYPELLQALHERASGWFEKHEFPAEAISHALQAGDPERATRLLETIAKPMVLRGESGSLLRWLDKLPSGTITTHPELIIAKAWARVTDGQFDEIEILLEGLAKRNDLAPGLRGEIAAIRAIVATVHQDIPSIQQQAALALKYLPAGDSRIRGVMDLSLGTAAALSGHPLQAVDLLERAVQESRQSDQPILSLVAMSTLAQAYEALGQLDQAARLHQQVIALETDPILGILPLIGMGYVGLGGILHERLQFSEAEAALKKGLSIGERWGSPEIQIGAYFSLARLRYTQGDLAAAQEMLVKLEAEFLYASPLLEREHVQAMKARILLSQGRLANVDAWAKACGLDENGSLLTMKEYQYLVLTRNLLAKHEESRALRFLVRLEQDARTGQRTSSLIEITLLQASAHQALGQHPSALIALEAALLLAEPQNQRRVFVDEPDLQPVLQRHLAQHAQDHFAAELLQACARRAAALLPETNLLSGRELEVLRLMADGLSNQQIADRLVLALSTIKSHVKSILMKLGADNRTQAVTRGRELRLL